MIGKTIKLSTQTLHYLEGGSGKTVILMPSLWLTSAAFKNVGAILAKQYHVLIPDIYKGKSQFKESATSIDDYCDVLNEFIDHLGLDKVSLIGISYSGFIFSYFAQNHPKKLHKVLLLTTTYIPLNMKNTSITALIGLLKMYTTNALTLKGMKTNIEWFRSGLSYFLRHPKQHFMEIILGVKMDRRVIKNIACKIPVKLILAEDDDFMRPHKILESHANIKNLEIEVIKGRHAWLFIEKEAFAKKVREFIH